MVYLVPLIKATRTETGHFPGTSLEMFCVCGEKWDHGPAARLSYSVSLMVVQFVIPISVIGVTHAKIIKTIGTRWDTGFVSNIV